MFVEAVFRARGEPAAILSEVLLENLHYISGRYLLVSGQSFFGQSQMLERFCNVSRSESCTGVSTVTPG